MRTHSKSCENAKHDKCNCSCRGKLHRTRKKIKGKWQLVPLSAEVVERQNQMLCAKPGCYNFAMPFYRVPPKRPLCATHKDYKGPVEKRKDKTYVVPMFQHDYVWATPALDQWITDAQTIETLHPETAKARYATGEQNTST
jgi:hypothetical protein